MKQFLLIPLVLMASLSVQAQVKSFQQPLSNLSLVDESLHFMVIDEAIKEQGTLSICIAQKDRCIENLQVGFIVRIYDTSGQEIWDSLWSGKNMDIRFKSPMPQAATYAVEATSDFVINRLTTNRISTVKPMQLNQPTQP
ncbi:MAG: hypothetical protein GWO77_02770 [Bacteroidetes bacterium]|nr:hypothetical protein [Bacteroidota bacterium]